MMTSGVGQAINQLPPDQITADLNAVADYCKSLPACNGKVCVVGFSWGGSQSFRFATNRKDLSAAFVCYGGAPDSIAAITAPVFGFYAGNDARISGAVPATQALMKAAGKSYEAVIYEGAAHGFMIEHASTFNKILFEFLRRVSTSQADAAAVS